MSKQFAYVNGLHKIFDTSTNEIGHVSYDTTKFKNCEETKNLANTTICYIVADSSDNSIDYFGNYIYTLGHLMANYNNYGGLYLHQGLINPTKDAKTIFNIGEVIFEDEYTPWSITYNVQVFPRVGKITLYDVYVSGVGCDILNYFTYTSICGEDLWNAPFKYHIVKTSYEKATLGLIMYDAIRNSTDSKNVSVTVSNLRHCKFNSINTTSEDYTDSINTPTIFDATMPGLNDMNSGVNVKIRSANISASSSNTLKMQSESFYGFDQYGKIAPFSNKVGNSTTLTYNTIGFQWERGLYYCLNYFGDENTFKGELYSECVFNGRLYDPVRYTFNDPIYLTGKLDDLGLFHIYPCTYTPGLAEHTTILTTKPSTETDVYYWLVGYLTEMYTITLVANNPLFKYDETKGFIPVSSAKTIEYTPTGTISDQTFAGTASTILVSGQAAGSNADSSVAINAITENISTLASVGSLPSLTYKNAGESLEELIFSAGTLPTLGSQSVWVGYNSATAAGQTFTGSTVTFTGSYTPVGTISQATFTGDTSTIMIN